MYYLLISLTAADYREILIGTVSGDQTDNKHLANAVYMNNYRFQSRQFIPRKIEDVFDFFSEAEHLEEITPSWLNFRIITPLPIVMYRGTRIVYRLQLYRLPVNWSTEITGWEPPVRFVDSQLSGPYTVWVHEHRFEKKAHGTLMFDTVDYNFRGGILRPLINRLFVTGRLQNIFEYRRAKIKEILG